MLAADRRCERAINKFMPFARRDALSGSSTAASCFSSGVSLPSAPNDAGERFATGVGIALIALGDGSGCG